MARISGVDVPREKRVLISLTYIHGIGRTSAANVCEAIGVDPTTRVLGSMPVASQTFAAEDRPMPWM